MGVWPDMRLTLRCEQCHNNLTVDMNVGEHRVLRCSCGHETDISLAQGVDSKKYSY